MISVDFILHFLVMGSDRLNTSKGTAVKNSWKCGRMQNSQVLFYSVFSTFLSFLPATTFFTKFWALCALFFFNSHNADLQATPSYQLAHRSKAETPPSRMVQQSSSQLDFHNGCQKSILVTPHVYLLPVLSLNLTSSSPFSVLPTRCANTTTSSLSLRYLNFFQYSPLPSL